MADISNIAYRNHLAGLGRSGAAPLRKIRKIRKIKRAAHCASRVTFGASGWR
jgi:hypothetical protein